MCQPYLVAIAPPHHFLPHLGREIPTLISKLCLPNSIELKQSITLATNQERDFILWKKFLLRWPTYYPSPPKAGGGLRILCLLPEDCSTMRWLMKFRVLWDTQKSCHGFHPALQRLCCQSLSGAGAPRWNDYDTPEEFNFASDVLDYWTQMEKVRRHPWWGVRTGLTSCSL